MTMAPSHGWSQNERKNCEFLLLELFFGQNVFFSLSLQCKITNYMYVKNRSMSSYSLYLKKPI